MSVINVKKKFNYVIYFVIQFHIIINVKNIIMIIFIMINEENNYFKIFFIN